MRTYEWRRFALIYSYDESSLSLATEVINYAHSLDFEILEIIIVDESQIEEQLKVIKERNFQVIMAISYVVEAQNFFNTASQILTNQTWILADGVSMVLRHTCENAQKSTEYLDDDNCLFEESKKFCCYLNGSISVFFKNGIQDRWESLAKELDLNDGDELTEDMKTGLRWPYSSFLYDILTIVANVFEKYPECRDLDGECKNYLTKERIDGINGNVSVSDNINAPISIVNFLISDNGDITYKEIGFWSKCDYLQNNLGLSIECEMKKCPELCKQVPFHNDSLEDHFCNCYNVSEDMNVKYDESVGIDIFMVSKNIVFGRNIKLHGDGTIISVYYLTWDSGFTVFIVIALITFYCLSILTFAVIVKYRKTPIMIYASFPFLLMSLSGNIIISTSSIFWAQKPSAAICNLRMWLQFLGLSLSLVPLILKTYRIWKIFKPRRKLKRVRLTTNELLIVTIFFLLFIIILLTIQTAVFPMKNSECLGDLECVLKCTAKNEIILYLLYVINAILLVCLVFFSIQTRRAPTQYRETHWINVASILMSFIIVLGACLVIALKDQIYENYVYSIMFLSLSYTMWGCLFVPKLYIALIRPEKNVVRKKGK